MNLRRYHIRPILLALALVLVTYKVGWLAGLKLFVNISDFIFIISVIVFIHEFGHYIVAKWAGVKIETFSIGFGREITGFNDRSGTRWKLSILPFGGYVKMYGDASEASTPLESIDKLSAEEKNKTFHYKPLYKKAAIVAAGPLFNFLLTVCILTYFIASAGYPSSEPVVGEVMKDTPAAAAGLHPGDRILSINDDTVDTFFDISRLIMTNLGTPVTLDVRRDGKEMRFTLIPKKMTDKEALDHASRPIIGITSRKLTVENIGLLRSFAVATRETYYICVVNLQAIGQLVTGSRNLSENIKGPISIARLSGQAAEKGATSVLSFIATFSASLGLINLFPIPVLDGGHLLYYAIEAVQGRPLAKRAQEVGMRIGMAMIAMLMTYAVLNDIRNWLLSV